LPFGRSDDAVAIMLSLRELTAGGAPCSPNNAASAAGQRGASMLVPEVCLPKGGGNNSLAENRKTAGVRSI
jgi:hypothetical protein